MLELLCCTVTDSRTLVGKPCQDNTSMRAGKPTSVCHALLLKLTPSQPQLNQFWTKILNHDERNLLLGQSIHAQLIKTARTGLNVFQANNVVGLYAKCGQIVPAFQLFNEMPSRNLFSWSILMAGFMQNGMPLQSLELFVEMYKSTYVCPNEYVLATAVSSCAEVGAFDVGRLCHAYAWKSGFIFHLYVGNTLVHMYSSCNDVGGALSVFKSMRIVDSFSCNSMISGLLANGYLSEALHIVREMVYDSLVIDPVTYVNALALCSSSKLLKLGLQLHGQILRRDLSWDVYVGSALVDMYGKCGKIVSARNSFNRLLDRNVVSWTSMMACYAHNGFFEEALNFYTKIMGNKISPNELTFSVMMNSCANLSDLGLGSALHCIVEKLGFEAHVVVGNALINMYSRSGSIEDAHMVFECMHQREVLTWNSMISAYSHHGLGAKALKVFECMLMAGESPNYITFVGVLSACAHLGLVNEGFYYLNHMMKEMNITPGLEHYTCMVGLLSRAGQLDDAESFLRYTHVEWDVVAWRTLLSACQVYRNFGIGKRVAEIILQLDPNDVGTYILLSNIYAKSRRWDGVASIRKHMKEKEIKKEPGVSWIQVRNSTHIFVSDDRAHPQLIEIYKKLEQLMTEIKKIGYVPNFDMVFHDLEDEQKDVILKYHSEKLAIAFGLLNIPLDAPIRVIKNLRICEDCHTSAKLISDVTKRKIIIRDVNRFHCFESGSCSCRDYW